MQVEMIKEIEEAKPKFLVFFKIPTSWLIHPNAEVIIFDWFNNYAKRYYHLVGIADLYSNMTIFKWDKEAAHYKSQKDDYLVYIFERRKI